MGTLVMAKCYGYLNFEMPPITVKKILVCARAVRILFQNNWSARKTVFLVPSSFAARRVLKEGSLHAF